MREAKQHGGVPNAPATVVPNNVNGGFTWFFDAASKMRIKNKEASNVTIGDPEPKLDITQDTPSADDEVNELLLKNPEITGAALVSAMKSNGLKVSKITEAWARRIILMKHKESSHFEQACDKLRGKGLRSIVKKEADSASSFAQVTRERDLLPSKFKINSMTLRESERDNLGEVDSGHKLFDVQLIEEGLGNFNDAYYYHREALESAVSLFTGLKIYADHPSTFEEETRPERSTRDILGHYEQLSVTNDADEPARLIGKVDILSTEQWAIARMQRAIENAKKFPDKDFVGVSINASGDAEETPIDDVLEYAPAGAKPKLLEAKANGIESVKVVRKLNAAISCDFVTEAGAGGKILNLIEGSKTDGQS